MIAAWIALLSVTGAPPRKCEVYTSLSGSFTAQAQWLVNRINAPKDDELKRPADLAIAPDVLAALNAAALPAVDRALTKGGRRPCRDTFKGPPPLKKLPPGTRPTQYALHVAVGGFDDLGGQYPGTEVRVEMWTLGLEEDLVGRAARRVTALGTSTSAVDDLDAVLSGVLDEADKALAQAIKEASESRPRTLTVILDFYSIDRAGADAAIELMPCIVKAGGGISHAPTRAWEKNTEAFEVRFRTPAKDGEAAAAAFVQRFADAISANVGSHGKYRCSLFRTPLDGRAPRVRVDAEKATIRVQLVKP